MRSDRLHRFMLATLLFFLAFSVLWKGGKTLESTWLLVAVAWGCVFASWRRFGNDAHAAAFADIPRGLWFSAIGFALWTALSFLTSSTQNYGLDEVLRDGSLMILFCTVVREARRDSSWRDRLLTVLAVTACCAAAIGIAVYVLQPVNRAVGTFFDHRYHTDYWPNAWAEFLLLAWPVVLWWARRAQGRPRLLRFALLGVVLGTLLLSYSRGSLLAFIGQLVLGVCFIAMAELRWGRDALLRFRTSLRSVLTVAAVAVLTFIAVNAVRGQFFDVESVLRKATFTADEGASSVSERSQFWQQALTLSHSAPFLGHGPYSFRFLQPALQVGVYETSDHPHNVFLKLAMERGWPAAILFGLVVGIVLLRAFAVLRRAHAPHLFLTAVLFLSIAGTIAHNLIDYNLQFVGIVLPLVVLLALAESLHTPVELGTVQRRMRRGAEVALLSILLVVAISEGRFLIVSSLGRRAEARGDFELALRWYDASRGEIFTRDLELSRASTLLRLKRIGEARAAIETYEQRNAVDARAWKMRGDVARLQGAFAEARSAYEVAFAYGRYNYLSILEGLLLVWDDLGDATSPLVAKPEIMETMRRYADAVAHNVHFVALSDNVETFLRIAPVLQALYPDREAEFSVLAAQVDRSADRERERMDARRPGMLW